MKSVLSLCVIVCAIVAIVFGLRVIERWQASKSAQTWQTYISETFNFSIQIPGNWVAVEFPNDEIAPRINFYPQKQKLSLITMQEDIEHISPLSHHSPVFNISVFPHGFPSEGFFGKFIPSDISFNEEIKTAHDFILKDGSRFATFAAFTKIPPSWNEDGFIWGYALKKGTRTQCLRGEKRISDKNCDPLTGDTIKHSAWINEKDREIQKMILSTFTFGDSN